MLRRKYSNYREAYTPRWWVALVITLAIITLILYFTDSPIITFVAPFVVAFAVSNIQWAWWRHRHPPKSFTARQRENARWQ